MAAINNCPLPLVMQNEFETPSAPQTPTFNSPSAMQTLSALHFAVKNDTAIDTIVEIVRYLAQGKSKQSKSVPVEITERWLAAIDEITEQVHRYQAKSRREGRPQRQLKSDLQSLIDRPCQETLSKLLADQDRAEELLIFLWLGGFDSGVLINSQNPDSKGMLVEIEGNFENPPRGVDGWLKALLRDPSSIRTAAQKAMKIYKQDNPNPDWLRQFRDLEKHPTKLRLINILSRDEKNDEDGLEIAKCAIRFALLELNVFGKNIPDDWIEQLGERSDDLSEVAGAVCEQFTHACSPSGPVKDKALEVYADTLCKIYETLTGEEITYAKATETSKREPAGTPYGPGLKFILAGLQLINPNATKHQATAQIDRYRGWRKS